MAEERDKDEARPRRRGFWRWFASDQRTAASTVLAVVWFVTHPSWRALWPALVVFAIGVAAYAWWTRHGD